MLLRQPGEVVEGASGFIATVAIERGPEVAMQGIDDEQAGVTSREGVFEDWSVAETESGGWRGGVGEDSAEQDEAGGVAIELFEAGTDYFGASVFGGGVEDGAGFLGFGGEGKAAAT